MEGCIFCKIANREMPAAKLYEDEKVVAFLDIVPCNKGHALIIPKKHYETLLDMPDKEASELFGMVKKISGQVKSAMKADGISIAQSNGIAAGQLVQHVHFHVIPRFMNEGPVALEERLNVKRMDDKILDQVAEAIKKGKLPATKEVTPEKIVRESSDDDDFSLDDEL